MWQKVEQEVLEPIRGMVWVEKSQQAVTKTSKRWLQILNQSIFNWRMLLFGIGFLLGRAMILAEMSPFALPFAASVFVLRKERTGIAVFAILAGAMSHQPMNALFFISALLVYASLQKGVDLFIKNRMQSLPLLVFGSSLITRTVFSMFGEGGLERVDTMLALVEGGLSLVLTLIFLQSIPLLTNKKIPQSLKNEEIVCLMILLASVMTGTIGWQINDVAIEHVVSRYLVLLFAFVGGAAIGSTVGVVTGLILSLAQVASLSQMSLLAFSGLLGGLLKEGKRFGVSLGLIIGTVMIGLYGEGRSEITSTLMESGFAVLLFLLTPKTAISNISKYVPGTREHSMHQQQYLKKIRDVTASRVERFSSLFQALSHSFQSVGSSLNEEESTREVDLFLSNITEKTCQTCFKKEQCWAQNFTTTYDLMTRLMVEQEDYSDIKDRKLKRDWEKHCIKPEKITDLMKKELTQYRASQKLKIQVQESRRLVADQLMGVSQVMGDFAKEIQREQENHQIQEEQIKDSLAQAGIDVGHVDIYSLETSNVDIEMTIPSCNGSGIAEKLIAPILSDILEETILVTHEDCANYPTGFCHLSFHSAREYVVETGIASAAKGGAWLSGDSHSTIEIGAGKFAVAIADGMGNGERAFIESNETLQLLQKILQSGIDEEVAIKSVNSVLSLRTTDEIFSTLDLAMIDLQDASAKFLKIGSTPSFIKRGDQIKTVEASNLPMGIIRDFDVDVVDEQLKAGDILIMMSDGIYEAPRHIENIDAWLKRKIREIDTEDPQEIADLIMEEVIRLGNNGIEDDMTVAVTKIEKNIPKWATVPQYPKVAINRKKAQ
ncbi:stage II sporulation protein E [Fictibacillus norfolkensis]|jgi:stage II sporulation protein E|uniref:Stage II sporulation protein E n=1 Tax=Fictibacillus norfolkensis TaxID=2762233 RepID=A0ABR8SRT9_9BACL|nr:stage II sporulation protein E [Fictibacillus norfolkensis]MBD7966213.1 stage II sporulation protein E [Fictibacillus norfolkensis]